MRPKILIAERHDSNIMGENLQLENLAQELAKNLNMTLSDKPRDDVAEAVTYWKIGSNGQYTLDHTVVNDQGSYLAIDEEIKISAPSNQCREEIKAGVISHVGLDRTEFYIRFHGQTEKLGEYRQRLRKLTPSRLQRFYDLLELEVERQECEKTAGIACECFDAEANFDTADDFKELPRFIKEFYG